MRLRELVNLATAPAFAIGAGQVIVAVNEAAASLIGEPVEAIIGRNCAQVMSAVDPSGEHVCREVDCPVFIAMQQREPVSPGWTSWIGADGRTVPVSTTVVASPEHGQEHAPSDDDVLVIVHVQDAPKSGVPALEVRLLGATTLAAHGQRIPLPRRRRAVELLTYLAFAGLRGAHRDRLLEDFWPDVPAEQSAPRLRVLLHAVRQMLTAAGLAGAVEHRGGMYVLDTGAGARIDALEFEALARRITRAPGPGAADTDLDRALALYQGDLADGEEFGAWVVPHAERLRRLYHDLLRAAAHRFAQRGAIDRSVECCEIALRSDPLQEQFQIALIAYYGHLGRRSDAIRQYEDYRRILASETGTEPTPATERALRTALGGTRA